LSYKQSRSIWKLGVWWCLLYKEFAIVIWSFHLVYEKVIFFCTYFLKFNQLKKNGTEKIMKCWTKEKQNLLIIKQKVDIIRHLETQENVYGEIKCQFFNYLWYKSSTWWTVIFVSHLVTKNYLKNSIHCINQKRKSYIVLHEWRKSNFWANANWKSIRLL
jgi:hypothetical protein